MLRASAQHIVVTPLAGTQLEAADPNAPQATLVRIDRLTLLVDCGASPDFGPEVVDAVRPFAASIDAVLLSSSELRCCGSLPMVLDILRPDVVVCGTIPTAKVGLLSTITHMLDRTSTAEAEPQLPAPVTAVHAAFKRIREVQFEQSIKLMPLAAASHATGGTTTAIQIRAHAAGRVAGAAAYLITHQSDSVLLCQHAVPDSIRSMSVRSFDPPTGGATVIVADAGAMGRESAVDTQDTEKRALRVIRDTFRRGGSVLIPVDTFATGAEVLVLLQKLFAEEGLSYPLVFASPKASAYTDRLRTLIEFVQDGVFSEEHDEAFPGVTMANSHDELDALPTAKCVIAQCSADFTAGFGAALLTTHLQDPLSAVIIPQPLAAARTDGNMEHMRRLVDGNRPSGPMRIDAWSYLRRDLLEGDALADFMDELAAKKDQEAEAAAAGGDNDGRDAVMIQELAGPTFEDDDDDDDQDLPVQAATAAPTAAAETHPRLVLPAHFPPFNSAFPLFPPVQLSLPPSATNTVGVDANTSIYGEALPDADIRRFRQHTAQHTYAEAALSAAQIVRTAVQVDSAPARVVPVTIPLVAKAPVHVFDLSRRCTGDALRSMLGDSLAGARKLVFIGGTPTDAAAARTWAEAARVTKHSDSTFAPRNHESVDLSAHPAADGTALSTAQKVTTEAARLRSLRPAGRVRIAAGTTAWHGARSRRRSCAG